MNAKVVYLVPNDWGSDNASLFIHSWGGTADVTGKMIQESENLYRFDIGNNTSCLFVRQDPALGNNINWDAKWNQTANLTIPANKDCYTITGWGDKDGSWSAYGVDEQTIALAGTMNNWNASAISFVLSDDESTASTTIYLEVGSYEFKVIVNGQWLGNTGEMTRNNCTGWSFQKGDGAEYNCKIIADVAGKYVFNWTLSGNKLSVIYPVVGDDSNHEEIPANCKAIYLNTGGERLWNQANAKFFVHSWGEQNHLDGQMSLVTGDVYKAYVPEDHTHIIFLRTSPLATEVLWEGDLYWNQTDDLIIPAEQDCYTIRGWKSDQGAWTVYGVDDYPAPLFGTAVPSACPDVMLQGFYWDSNQDKYYGNTRWSTLQGEATELASYFDLIWLPPSAYSTGGLGYIPKQYSNQNSDLGSREELETLIKTLHEGGAKVVADMVVNHIDGKDGWCNYYEQDFGEYGKFQVDPSYISQNDEMNYDDAARDCRPTGAWEDGYGSESNYGAARDFAHDDEKVRQMFRAYAKWMINVMKYDGFRYDYCKGFHMSHVDDYNANAGAYFSVLEYYDGNRDELWNRISDAKENTLAFDFGMKFNVLNDGIAQFNYGKCKNPNCLIGAGKGKWAVNFIDNHDTFERGNGCDFGGNSMSDDMKDRLLQANAFILSMPGVPCLFYPHWKKYKNELKAMIMARKAVGVHSESAVSDEAAEDATGYRAYVTGTNGTLILELGGWISESHWEYTKVISGPGYAMWIKPNTPVSPELTISPNSMSYRTSTINVEMSAVGRLGETPTIYYTLDSSDPKNSSTKQKYTNPLTISGTVVLKAYADSWCGQSAVQTCVYAYESPQGDVTTGSDNITPPVLDITIPMYNILGQRVGENYHGIVIQKGYKYIR